MSKNEEPSRWLLSVYLLLAAGFLSGLLQLPRALEVSNTRSWLAFVTALIVGLGYVAFWAHARRLRARAGRAALNEGPEGGV